MAINNDPKLPERLDDLRLVLQKILREHGYAIREAWDDLTFPVQGINPAGSPAPATVDNTTYPGTLLFPTTTNAHIGGVAQMPHAWKAESELRPHIHWSKTVADGSGLAVAWEFRYAVVNIGSVVPAMSAWQVGTLEKGDLTSAEKHNLTSFPAISMTGKTLSSMVIWELRRNVANDNYGNDARLMAIDFHYQKDTFGSYQEYIK